MALQTQRAGWKSRGWMSFTVANGGLLRLGGASQTAPTTHFSGGVSGATGFLAAGIPQVPDASRFADIAIANDVNGHSIKNAIITITSAGATTPEGRKMTDGSVPTTALGSPVAVGDVFQISNSRDEIFNFKLFNRSGGNMVIDIEVFE